MELEFHQLDRRYEQLRMSCPKRESLMLASLDRHGQQLPAVVVGGGDQGGYIVVDGYKRIRALLKLGRDTIRATCWDLSEDEALLLGRLMQTAEGDSALEQGWLLCELRERFELTIEELARRFGRSMSWVSGRLGLVKELPDAIQDQVRRGFLVPHAAMKYLLPLSRTNRQQAVALAAAISPLRPSTRQTEAICIAFARGDKESQQYLLSRPELFLRARETGEASLRMGEGELLLKDIGALAGITARARGRVSAGAVRELLPPEQDELARRADTTRGDIEKFFENLQQEIKDAGRAHQDNNSQTP